MSTRTRTGAQGPVNRGPGARKVLETTRTGRWARESLAKERPPPRGAPGPFPLFSFIKGRRSSGGNPSVGTQKCMFSHHFANGCRALHSQETPGTPSETPPETPSEPLRPLPRQSQKTFWRHSSEHGAVLEIAFNFQDQMYGGTLTCLLGARQARRGEQ